MKQSLGETFLRDKALGSLTSLLGTHLYIRGTRMLSQPLWKVSAARGVLWSENLCIAEVSKEWHLLFQGGNYFLVNN